MISGFNIVYPKLSWHGMIGRRQDMKMQFAETLALGCGRVACNRLNPRDTLNPRDSGSTQNSFINLPNSSNHQKYGGKYSVRLPWRESYCNKLNVSVTPHDLLSKLSHNTIKNLALNCSIHLLLSDIVTAFLCRELETVVGRRSMSAYKWQSSSS